MTSAIEFDGVSVRFGPRKALDGLTLSVARGEILGFLGPNGAGKSTAIKALLGLVRPCAGRVTLNGLEPSDARSRESVGFLPEEASYPRFLSAVETLDYYGKLCRMPSGLRKKRIPETLERVGLGPASRRPLSTYSKGMMQKLGLAQALLHDPATLVLDEPASGLDPLARMDLRTLLHDLRRQGKTVFFSSHELSEVELVCDSLAILKDGRVIRSGPLASLLGSDHERNLERFFLAAMGMKP